MQRSTIGSLLRIRNANDRNTHIVLGRIVHAHVDVSVWKDGRVDARLLETRKQRSAL
jgi:hypothetical protein